MIPPRKRSTMCASLRSPQTSGILPGTPSTPQRQHQSTLYRSRIHRTRYRRASPGTCLARSYRGRSFPCNCARRDTASRIRAFGWCPRPCVTQRRTLHRTLPRRPNILYPHHNPHSWRRHQRCTFPHRTTLLCWCRRIRYPQYILRTLSACPRYPPTSMILMRKSCTQMHRRPTTVSHFHTQRTCSRPWSLGTCRPRRAWRWRCHHSEIRRHTAHKWCGW